jgi:hypothetical protein
MNKNTAIIVIFLIIAAMAGFAAFLVLREAPRDNIEEYEFRPLAEEERQRLIMEMSATSGSKLGKEEERAVIASTSAKSSGSKLSEEEERALVESMTAPGN